MAKKNSATALPKYTLPKAQTGIPAKGKITVPRVAWDALPETLEKLIELAEAGHRKANGDKPPVSVKGVLTLY